MYQKSINVLNQHIYLLFFIHGACFQGKFLVNLHLLAKNPALYLFKKQTWWRHLTLQLQQFVHVLSSAEWVESHWHSKTTGVWSICDPHPRSHRHRTCEGQCTSKVQYNCTSPRPKSIEAILPRYMSEARCFYKSQ